MWTKIGNLRRKKGLSSSFLDNGSACMVFGLFLLFYFCSFFAFFGFSSATLCQDFVPFGNGGFCFGNEGFQCLRWLEDSQCIGGLADFSEDFVLLFADIFQVKGRSISILISAVGIGFVEGIIGSFLTIPPIVLSLFFAPMGGILLTLSQPRGSEFR